MWLIVGFRRVLVGFWRLLVGLAIGVFLYVYSFLHYDGLFTGVHDFTRDFIGWVRLQPSMLEYAKWNEILKIQDKLAFALYVLFGRFLWMLFETVFIIFPYWLVFGRNEGKRANPPVASPLSPVEQKPAVEPGSPPLPSQGIIPEPVQVVTKAPAQAPAKAPE